MGSLLCPPERKNAVVRMYVCFDEIESGNAVVFRKNEIVATGMHDRLVQHVTFLATVSFMPEDG